MESQEKEPESNNIQDFLRINLPIIILIGVFAAVAKYFIGDGSVSNPNIIFLSVLSSLLIIFLLIIFALGIVPF